MPYLSSFERRGMERGLERGLERGMERGLERGLELGRQDLCGLVRSQLTKRFGALPPTVEERLRHASPTQLQAWGEAVLDSPTLDAVFVRR